MDYFEYNFSLDFLWVLGLVGSSRRTGVGCGWSRERWDTTDWPSRDSWGWRREPAVPHHLQRGGECGSEALGLCDGRGSGGARRAQIEG